MTVLLVPFIGRQDKECSSGQARVDSGARVDISADEYGRFFQGVQKMVGRGGKEGS